MRIKIENLGPAPIIIKDALGYIHRLEPRENDLFIGPAQGRLIDGQATNYRCSPAD